MNYSLVYRPLEAFEGFNANTKNKSIRRKYARRVIQFLNKNPVTLDNIEDLFTDRKYQTLFSDIIKSKAGGLFDLTVTQNDINGKSIRLEKVKQGYLIDSGNTHTTVIQMIFHTIFPDNKILRSGFGSGLIIYSNPADKIEYESEVDALKKRIVELETMINNIKAIVN